MRDQRLQRPMMMAQKVQRVDKVYRKTWFEESNRKNDIEVGVEGYCIAGSQRLMFSTSQILMFIIFYRSQNDWATGTALSVKSVYRNYAEQ